MRACVLVVWLAAALLPEFSRPDPAQRPLPPGRLSCDRNHLTSFTGAVTSYDRRAGRTRIAMRTDEETDEAFTLRHPGSSDPSRRFLLRGAAFTEGAWREIESRPGHLLPGMRAIVWVCDDGSPPLVDWRPPEKH